MKRYERPEIELVAFDVEDIITTSADIFSPQTEIDVEGVKLQATDFGTERFSIFTQPVE